MGSLLEPPHLVERDRRLGLVRCRIVVVGGGILGLGVRVIGLGLGLGLGLGPGLCFCRLGLVRCSRCGIGGGVLGIFGSRRSY